ncbi:MAG: hypothetical protein J0L92_08030 [Deltaproteobacteria bacterium]|nr:hypothetical protein [Deltaproteobacteria bacterium]
MRRSSLALGLLVWGVAAMLGACEPEGGAGGRRGGRATADAGMGDAGIRGGTVDADTPPPPDGCADREICGNGVDDDCNGDVDERCGCVPGQTQRCYLGDRALAGVGACREGTQTCDDVDGEFSSWGACTGEAGPSTEACDGREDEDCDGTVDEGCGCALGESRECYTGPASTRGVGVCRGGMQTCVTVGSSTDWSECTGETTPRPDLCDGVDRDCDGRADTGCDCEIGDTRACYTGPDGTSGVGLCHDGLERCVPAHPGATWGPCEGDQTPEMDLCDGVDRTCTGVPGVGCTCIRGESRACYGGPPATRGVGVCREGRNACVDGAGGPEWSADCAGERQPGTEICDNGADDDCDGEVDEGCRGSVMCPGDVTVPAGQPVSLTITSMGITSQSWRVVSAPEGGAETAEWSPTPPTATTESFTPYIVGEYVIEVTGTLASGMTVTCRFRVTALPHGLRVQLRWDGAGDVDLHVHGPTTSTPWFSSPDDCYYANTSPAWGASLDLDNTTADGPENINLDEPVTGSSYTIAVHNYARAAGRTASIDVFCGARMSTMPTATFTSRPLAGTAAGNCTANDFWTVARVTFTSPSTCTVTPIDTYRASSLACTAL